MSGLLTTGQNDTLPSGSSEVAPDGNPFADESNRLPSAGNMMRTLPSLQASFTSAGTMWTSLLALPVLAHSADAVTRSVDGF